MAPALSAPISLAPNASSVGIQIVGRYCDELCIRQFAQALEQVALLRGQRYPVCGH